MIAREWSGETTVALAADYARHLERTTLAECRTLPGNRGVLVRHFREGDRVVFLVTTLWDSVDAIRQAAGEDWERAVPDPGGERFLVRSSEYAQHAEVAACGWTEDTNAA